MCEYFVEFLYQAKENQISHLEGLFNVISFKNSKALGLSVKC